MQTQEMKDSILFTEKGIMICDALNKLNNKGVSDSEIIQWMREWGVNFDA